MRLLSWQAILKRRWAIKANAIAALLPRAWPAVAPLLLLLSALSVARPVAWTVGSYLISRERTRALMMLAGELLEVAAHREARQIDEKLFLEITAPPVTETKAASGRRR